MVFVTWNTWKDSKPRYLVTQGSFKKNENVRHGVHKFGHFEKRGHFDLEDFALESKSFTVGKHAQKCNKINKMKRRDQKYLEKVCFLTHLFNTHTSRLQLVVGGWLYGLDITGRSLCSWAADLLWGRIHHNGGGERAGKRRGGTDSGAPIATAVIPCGSRVVRDGQ